MERSYKRDGRAGSTREEIRVFHKDLLSPLGMRLELQQGVCCKVGDETGGLGLEERGE